jgi:hypothetical protein
MNLCVWQGEKTRGFWSFDTIDEGIKMQIILADWPSKNFTSGGGDASLFYVVFGNVNRDNPLSRNKYRFNNIPDGIELMSYGPTTHPEIVKSFFKGFLWEQLEQNQPLLAKKVSEQEHCIIVRGTIPDPKDLNYLRDTIGLITYWLDNGGVCVYDPFMFQWWSPDLWRERIFEPAASVPRHHTLILISCDSDNTEWIHTRGMCKFGRPDLSIHKVNTKYRDAVIDLCNRLIEVQAFGTVISEGYEIRMNSLPAGMRCFHRGKMDDPDFNNVHLEIEWPSGDI